MQTIVHEDLVLPLSQQVERWPLSCFSKAIALEAGLEKVTAASSTEEQLQRQLHVLQQQLETQANHAAKARAKAEHFRLLYERVMSNAH